jgi:hypothetical protein
MSLELDEAADGRRGPLPHGDTGAMWRARNARGLKALNADHDPVAALALLANLDKSGHQRARDRMLQDRVPKAECLQLATANPAVIAARATATGKAIGRRRAR